MPRSDLGLDPALLDGAGLGRWMHDLAAELLPIPRSLTGAGVRETFRRLAADLPGLETVEIPSGTRLYDWTVPDEWTIREAWLADPSGRRVVDMADSTLHVLGHSEPVRATMPLDELRPHLHTLPDHPDWVPFRTSYWERAWGLCLSHRLLESLPDGDYEVVIDADLAPGDMTYAELVIPGSGPGEVLLSTPACHPALANDNLSGMVLLAGLAARLAAREERRHTYRFLWSPGTIGPLAWLSRNEDRLDRIVAGFAVMCVGDPGRFTYKRSRRGDALVDRAAVCALRDLGVEHDVIDWVPWGGDERQFCSPGFDLPVGVLTRTPPGAFPENHTSADDLAYVTADALGGSAAAYLAAIDVLEHGDLVPLGSNQRGEPQLGRRGLTRRMGGQKGGTYELALFWVLNLADGRHSLLDIAERSGLPFGEIRAACAALRDVELVREETPRWEETP
ncbi:MAG: DUF4910 domain-containing protein [Thermoleophilia bacterium]